MVAMIAPRVRHVEFFGVARTLDDCERLHIAERGFDFGNGGFLAIDFANIAEVAEAGALCLRFVRLKIVHRVAIAGRCGVGGRIGGGQGFAQFCKTAIAARGRFLAHGIST